MHPINALLKSIHLWKAAILAILICPYNKDYGCSSLGLGTLYRCSFFQDLDLVITYIFQFCRAGTFFGLFIWLVIIQMCAYLFQITSHWDIRFSSLRFKGKLLFILTTFMKIFFEIKPLLDDALSQPFTFHLLIDVQYMHSHYLFVRVMYNCF